MKNTFLVSKQNGSGFYSYTTGDGWNQKRDTIRSFEGADLEWYKPFPVNCQLTCVISDQVSGFYAAGYYFDSIQLDQYKLVGKKGHNSWIGRFDGNGEPQWIKNIKGFTTIGSMSLTKKGIIAAGSVQDSVDFLGHVFSGLVQYEILLAQIGGDGALLNIVSSVGSNTIVGKTYSSFAWVNSCGVDGEGNFYILARAFGEVKVDSITLGRWKDVHEFGFFQTAILKLNEYFKPIRTTLINDCAYSCVMQEQLKVQKSGECIYVENYGYSQSGADDYWGRIRRLDNNGNLSNMVYHPESTLRNGIAAIEIDDCGDLYYLATCRNGYNEDTLCFFVKLGKLNNLFQEQWTISKGGCTNFVGAKGLAVLDRDRFLISGNFSDTLNMCQELNAGTDKEIGFISRIDRVSDGCNNVGLAENQKLNFRVVLVLQPNPSSKECRVVYDDSSFGSCRLVISDMFGRQVQTTCVDPKESGAILPLHELETGVYVVSLCTADRVIGSTRLVIAE